MKTKTIRIRESVYERVRARKREGETFSDTVDRLMDESDSGWRDGFGALSADEAESVRDAASHSRERLATALADRQRRTTEQFEAVDGGIGAGSSNGGGAGDDDDR